MRRSGSASCCLLRAPYSPRLRRSPLRRAPVDGVRPQARPADRWGSVNGRCSDPTADSLLQSPADSATARDDASQTRKVDPRRFVRVVTLCPGHRSRAVGLKSQASGRSTERGRGKPRPPSSGYSYTRGGIAMKARLLTLSVVVTAFLLALFNGGISTSPG